MNKRILLAVALLGGTVPSTNAFRAPDRETRSTTLAADAVGAAPPAEKRQVAALRPGALAGAVGTSLWGEAIIRYLKDHPEALGLQRTPDLRVDYITHVPGAQGLADRAYVNLIQTVNGVDVVGTSLSFSLDPRRTEIRLDDLQVRLYSELVSVPTGPVSLQSSRSLLQQRVGARRIQSLDRKVRFLQGRWRTVQEFVLPDEGLRGAVDGSGQTFIWDDRVYATYSGNVTGRQVDFDPVATGANLPERPLPHLRIADTLGNMTFTDAAGAYTFTTPSTANLSVGLAGRWGDVNDVAGADLVIPIVAESPNPVNILFNPTGNVEMNTAQVTAYRHTTLVHDWLVARGVNPVGINVSIPVNVNINASCNAYYDYVSINFYRSGGSCINTAFDTVIYHEYGHFVDDKIGGITNGGLSEGWGDVLATYITGQPLVGENWMGAGNSLRNANNNYIYNATDEVHAMGQAWMGFTWDLRTNLINSLGQTAGVALAENLVIPVLLANSMDIPAAVRAVALRDDNDGNLSNGTPHIAQIQAAANRHGLAFALDTTPPTAPPNPQFSSASFNQIHLAWGAATDNLAVAGYRLDVSTTSNFSTFVPNQNNRNVGNFLGSLITGLNPGTTYYARVRAYDAAQNVSANSVTVQGGTLPPDTIPPSAPANVFFSLPTETSLRMNWTAATDNASVAGYRLDISTRSDFASMVLFYNNFNIGNVTAYTLSSLTPGTTYYGRVRAYDVSLNTSANSPTAQGTTSIPDTTPPTVVMAPPPASPLSGLVILSGTASDNRAVTQVGILVDGVQMGVASGTTIWTYALDTWRVSNGTHTLSVRALDAAGNQGLIGISIHVLNAGSAAYDTALRVPRCPAGVSDCNTGGLVNGRANIVNGPEPNQPNTLQGTCADGISGTYHNDESLDRLRISTLDSTPFAPGKTVRVEATVWAFTSSGSNAFDLFYTTNVVNPTWVYIRTMIPSATGNQVLPSTFTLASGGTVQAIRGTFRYGGAVTPCSPGNYDDHDDLAFQIAGASDTVPPTAPANASFTSPTSSAIFLSWTASTDNVGVMGYRVDVSTVSTFTVLLSTYTNRDVGNTTSLTVMGLTPGTTYYARVRAYDAAGNVSANSAVAVGATTVTDVIPPSVRITFPMDGSTVSGLLTMSGTASDNQALSRVDIFLDNIIEDTAVGTTAWTYPLDTRILTNGTHTLTAYAFDTFGNVSSTRTTVTVNNPVSAVYSSTFGTPHCDATLAVCDSGSLLLSRGTLIRRVEPQAPNTLNSSCPDGNAGYYHTDGSNDRIRVMTLDGTPLAPGKVVRIEATVWVYPGVTGDALDIYYAANASSPTWTYLRTIVPTARGKQVLTSTHTLTAGGANQVVRANFRYLSSPAVCTSGIYDDHDDLVFRVVSAPVITSTPTVSGTAGSAFSYQITATNNPTSFGATGLPAGLSINTTSGLISGTPTTVGISTITLTASNSAGTGTRSLILTIRAASLSCDLDSNGLLNAADVQLSINQVLQLASCTSDLSQSGSCDITDTYRVIRAVLGLGCVIGPQPNVAASGRIYMASRSAPAGGTVSMPVNLNLSVASSIAGLQFNLTLPASITTISVTPGSPVTVAVKTIQSNKSGSVWRFAVSGINSNVINAGQLMNLGLRINAGTPPGTLSIPISNIVFSNSNGQRITGLTDGGGSITVLAPAPLSAFIQQPQDQSVMAGQSVTFSVEIPQSDVMYQWQSRATAQGVFENIDGATEGSLTRSVVLSEDGHQFRVVASNGVNSMTSQAATLHVISSLSQPPTVGVTTPGASGRVYPSPWRADRHTGPITFDQFTDGSTIKIFTIAGQWVQTLSAPAGSATWDRKNSSGDTVSSGVYVYLVTDPHGNKVRGQFAILR
jgi:hypothetical protein